MGISWPIPMQILGCGVSFERKFNGDYKKLPTFNKFFQGIPTWGGDWGGKSAAEEIRCVEFLKIGALKKVFRSCSLHTNVWCGAHRLRLMDYKWVLLKYLDPLHKYMQGVGNWEQLDLETTLLISCSLHCTFALQLLPLNSCSKSSCQCQKSIMIL